MHFALVIFHVLICIALIVIVLLQSGKGADIGAVFGGSSQTLFGSSGGSTFFSKLTTAVAVIFMLTSLALAYRPSDEGSKSIMSGVKPAATATEKTAGQPAPAKTSTTGADTPAAADAQKEK